MTDSNSNIFCPNCGAKNRLEQNFCRFCSFHLGESARSLSAQRATGQNAGQLKKRERIKKISDFIDVGLIVAFSLWLFGLVYSLVTGASGYGNWRSFVGIGFALMILQSGVSYFIRKNTLGYAEELEKTRTLAQTETPQLEKMKTAKLLEEKSFEAVAFSVTENSTELFPLENKTGKLE